MSTKTSSLINTKSPIHEPSQKKENSPSTDMTNSSNYYEHRVAHAETIKVVNNRYFTPVTLKFAAITKEKTVNVAQKHVIVFVAIKILDPNATINSKKGVGYHHPKDFPYSHANQDAFNVISNKNTHQKPYIYVQHTIKSILTINSMMLDQRNLINTLLQQQVFLQFDKYSIHHEAYIGWFKYISIYLTLQPSVKLRVENTLKSAHLAPIKTASLTTTNYKPVTTKPLERSRKRLSETRRDVDNE